MATIKKYVKPCITIVSVNNTNILCSSNVDMKHICSESCKHWHFCYDRLVGKYCSDKKYK